MNNCCNFTAEFNEEGVLNAEFNEEGALGADFGEIQEISTNDYNDLFNKPKINGVELKGDKSFEDLGDEPLTNIEIKEIFNNIFGN